LRDLRIGYLKSDFQNAKNTNDLAALAKLRELGANLIPISLPHFPLNDIEMVLSVEAAAAFDDLTRSSRDDLMARQTGEPGRTPFAKRALSPRSNTSKPTEFAICSSRRWPGSFRSSTSLSRPV